MTEPEKEDPLSRANELENIVDELDEKVADEREAEGVPGKPSDRENARYPCLGERAARLGRSILVRAQPSSPGMMAFRRPRLGLLLEHAPCVDGHGKAGDVAGLVRGEEQHGVADVDGFDPANREHVHELRGDGQVVRARVREVGAEEFHRAVVHEQWGVFTLVGCTELTRIEC